MVESSHAIFLKFIRFSVVGTSGLLIDFVLTYVAKEKWAFNKYIANGIGFFAAASNNYFLNRIWTFSSTSPNVMEQYVQFVLFSLTGLLINSAIIWLFHDRFKRNFYLSKLVATAFVTVWNFALNFFFTFR